MNSPPYIFIGLGISVLLGIIIIGKGGNETAPNPSQPASVTQIATADTTSDQQSGPQVPDLVLTSLAGETVNLNQFVGQKAVVVDFWASWCPNCQRDMPKMQTMYDEYKESVEILAINLQEPRRDIEQFVSSRKLTYPVLLDSTGKASRTFGITYTNTHILITKSGQILGVLPGDIREDDIKQLIAPS
ncbi:redoxin domain-containing protein [Candidatus Berkelbacteria bacterium]|nr:redoxin domain-containing protein [Candidatus Berkelbacteria bacterium]